MGLKFILFLNIIWWFYFYFVYIWPPRRIFASFVAGGATLAWWKASGFGRGRRNEDYDAFTLEDRNEGRRRRRVFLCF